MTILQGRALSALGLGFAIALAAGGCGGDEPAATHNVKIDVGGSVVYAFDVQEGLAGVLVSLLDVDGELVTTTTNSAGLWTIENVRPGVYVEEYSLAGYDTMTATFAIPADGENNVENVFITRPTVGLSEISLVATVAPFGLSLLDGDSVNDGIGNVTAVYSSSGDTAITVTFNRRAEGFIRLTDGETDQDIFATPDANFMTWTFSEAAIGAINGGGIGGGLTTDTDPFTWHRIQVNVSSYTPIHGDLIPMDADVFFNAVP